MYKSPRKSQRIGAIMVKKAKDMIVTLKDNQIVYHNIAILTLIVMCINRFLAIFIKITVIS